MKTYKATSLLFFFILFSCVKDGNYTIPSLEIIEPDVTNMSSITFSAIESAYKQAIAFDTSANYVTFTDDMYTIGYVISNDSSGNFFEELIIQNTINDDGINNENPKMGMKIEINASSLYQHYEFGRKVYIKLKGLSAGIKNGVLTLGVANGTEIGQIGLTEYSEILLISTEIQDITPKKIDLINSLEIDMNTYIEISNTQFSKNQLSLTFSGEAFDEFDGQRTLENCENDKSITLLTSTFSDFKSINLPKASGTLRGILTKDYYGETTVIKVNSFSDFNFNNSRCDAKVLQCAGNMATDIIVFQEDFQNITHEDELDNNGWININTSGGSERYEYNTFSNDVYLKISAFGTNENTLEAWLITPEINLDTTTEEQLIFEISSNYESGKVLTAFVTENYTGSPTTTEWIELDANIPIGNDSFGSFIKSSINISCLSGNIRVAFKYLGKANSSETRYHIDDIRITGK